LTCVNLSQVRQADIEFNMFDQRHAVRSDDIRTPCLPARPRWVSALAECHGMHRAAFASLTDDGVPLPVVGATDLVSAGA